MRVMSVVFASILLAGCQMPEDQVVRAVNAAGMSDVQPGGIAWIGCSQGDDYGRKFTALDRSGNKVSGVVCGGLFKGATVRIN